MQRVLVLDIETLPNVEAARLLLNRPDDDEASLRAALGAHYARPGEEPQYAFVKAPLHRLCCLGVLVAERAASDEPWQVHRIRALTVDAAPEAQLLARFDASLRGGPSLVGFNTGGFDLPVLRYRALALGVPMPNLHAPAFAYLHRYGERHLDLMDRLSGFRASSPPSLGECAALLGLALKAEMDGERVEALWATGDTARIARYCRTDLAATWMLALRWWLATGAMPADLVRASLVSFADAIEEGTHGEGLEAVAAAARHSP